MKPRIITLTTDFGTADGYVGSVKGAILSINPTVRLIDLSNEIPSYDIVVGAFHLGCAFSFFPKGTIHLAVVDPGVGSDRRPILVVTRNHLFVGPDNGLFTLVVRRDPVVAIFELTEKRYFQRELSSTFHGRDLFGPVAAYLSRGIRPHQLGKRRGAMKLLKEFSCAGKILFFDKFGNAFTNIHRDGVKPRAGDQVVLGGKRIPLYRTYSEIPRGKPGALFGSSGFLEIAFREDSFENRLHPRRGNAVHLLGAS